jgi:RimJ/RimL family protein N-acetyltransferase
MLRRSRLCAHSASSSLLQPVLRGNRLLLRPLLPSDLEQLYAAASDPLIWAQHPASDRWQRPVFEAFFQKALESRGALVVTDNRNERNGERVIGTSRYYDAVLNASSEQVGPRKPYSEVAIGFTFLTREHWGGEVNGELKDLMLRHAFDAMGVRRVVFHIGARNLRSRAALEKIGGTLVGVKEGDQSTVVYEVVKALGPRSATVR